MSRFDWLYGRANDMIDESLQALAAVQEDTPEAPEQLQRVLDLALCFGVEILASLHGIEAFGPQSVTRRVVADLHDRGRPAYEDFLSDLITKARSREVLGPCPRCGALAPKEQKFCGECGNELSPFWVDQCPDCYTPRWKSDWHCRGCGKFFHHCRSDVVGQLLEDIRRKGQGLNQDEGGTPS